MSTTCTTSQPGRGTSTGLEHRPWHIEQVRPDRGRRTGRRLRLASAVRGRNLRAVRGRSLRAVAVPGWLHGLVPARPAPRRLASLYAGIVLFGVSVALMIAARLGLDPWDVFHQGLARRTGLPIGWIVNGTGAAVLLLWIPLRERPGIGTLSDAVLVGFVIDAALPLLPRPGAITVRVAFLLAAILLNAVATALYVGAGLGPGPRDGLMTALARRGWPIRRVRTSIELAGLAAGWLLGGTVGIGTLLYAVSIGPLVHVLLPRLTIADQVNQEGNQT